MARIFRDACTRIERWMNHDRRSWREYAAIVGAVIVLNTVFALLFVLILMLTLRPMPAHL